MGLVSSFDFELQPCCSAMSRRSFCNLLTILTGWVLSGRRSVTRMMVAARVVGTKHHSTYHRFFSAAKWSLDSLGVILFRRILPYAQETILLSLDDTLAHKRGRKMYGVGMHHDPLLSGQGKIVTSWGHNWVVLAMIVQFPLWPQRVFSLPILARLYVNTKAAAKWKIPYRSRNELALDDHFALQPA